MILAILAFQTVACLVFYLLGLEAGTEGTVGQFCDKCREHHDL